MAYLSLYRKYRSQDFDTIVGQQHIVQTIKNAIQTDRLAHAYIFAGPRGTGKTSLARILAKALNCAAGKTVTPCLKCPNCEKIKNGTAVDVIEIDAASNRGIDEIRQLREQVNFVPVESRYKVYIIDEAHMLTAEAFNALLKTLEEPPAHTLFVLATTEIQKIPATILSRCQRLDFKRIAVPEITAHLTEVCKKENVEIETKALNYIARLSDGCMRDALSLLDQLISFKGAKLTFDDILTLLGTTVNTALQELLAKIIQRDLNATLQMIDRMIVDGKNIQQVCRDLLDSLRNLLLIALQADNSVDLSSEEIAALRALAAKSNVTELRKIITVFSKVEADMRWNPNMRLVFELAVLELCALPAEPTTKAPTQNTIPVSKPVPQIKTQDMAPVLKPEPEPVLETMPAASIKPAPALEATPVKIEIKAATLTDIKHSWQIFIDKVKIAKPMLFALLNESQLHGYENNTLVLRFKESYGFHQKELLKPANKEIFKNILKETYGAEMDLDAILESDSKEQPAPVKPQEDAQTAQLLKIFPGKVVQR